LLLVVVLVRMQLVQEVIHLLDIKQNLAGPLVDKMPPMALVLLIKPFPFLGRDFQAAQRIAEAAVAEALAVLAMLEHLVLAALAVLVLMFPLLLELEVHYSRQAVVGVVVVQQAALGGPVLVLQERAAQM
jgi:hypothetical protein